MKQEYKREDYVPKQLLLTGFGAVVDTYNDRVKENLGKFEITYKPEFGNALAVLHFNKSERTGYIFFNSFDLQVKNEKGELQAKQTFYINLNKKPKQEEDGGKQRQQIPGSTYSLKEAYNLMVGRSVRKTFQNEEGNKYQAWVSLDLKNTDKRGNFLFKKNVSYDLSAALEKHPLKEREVPAYYERLIDSLERGNLQKVTFLTDQGEKPLYVRASPNTALKGREHSNLAVYDLNLQRLPSQALQAKTMAPEQAPQIPKDSAQQKQKDGMQEPISKGQKASKQKSTRSRKQRL